MGTPPPRISVGRLVVVGLVVFAANAALLVLQLVAGRLLSPFIGSSLETWTSVIGVFLAGIALGNGFGGRLADRYPTPRTLAALLAVGALTALWMVVFPIILQATGAHTSFALGPRIPILAFVLCFPAGLVLSLLTPLAIKLGLPDVGKAGRVAGVVFALGTLGCLLGNYLTGFYLIPSFTLDTIVYGCAGTLGVLALGTLLFSRVPSETYAAGTLRAEDSASQPRDGILTLRQAYRIVFLASFGAMTLELTGVRLLARELGVSLYTWTGIIGVMLAGTAVGNLVGGQIADRFARRSQDGEQRRIPLAYTLLFAGGTTVGLLIIQIVLMYTELFAELSLPSKVIGTTFALFFVPMALLGMVSPQVIRLAIPDVGHAGTIAGRIYGWSTGGAIAGTFAAGYLLLSGLGTHWSIIVTALLFISVATSVAPVWRNNVGLYVLSIVLGCIVGSFIVQVRQGPAKDPNQPGAVVAVEESNYYTILVTRDLDEPDHLKLNLDHLLHSVVNPKEPTYLYYKHEGIQLEMLGDAHSRNAEPRVLVIGGGGFTFPRCAKTLLPQAQVEVVEIDPKVTEVAEKYLGFDPKLGIPVHHMDGRQFVSEKVAPGTFDLIMLDAVNDLSVPSHLTTKEFNDAVKKGLSKDGVYLLTVIDGVTEGRLWKAAYRTLQKSFAHVELVSTEHMDWSIPDQRNVFVLYASDTPLRTGESPALSATVGTWSVVNARERDFTVPVPKFLVEMALATEPEIILTDQYAPVDNLLADVFRKRDANPKTKE